MLDFRPPLDTPVLIKTMNMVLPLYMKFALHGTRVEPVPGAVERFRTVAGKRGMICPNHSNRHDPQVMFALAKSSVRKSILSRREKFLTGTMVAMAGGFNI